MNNKSMVTFDTYGITESEIHDRIRKIQSSAQEGSVEDYKLILSCLDLTTLEGSDNNEKILSVCRKAAGFSPKVAAVCFYPPFVRLAKSELKNTGVKVAAVAGGFPSGQTSLRIKLDEVKWAAEESADEIDMVISRGKFLEGEYNAVFDEIAAIKEACGKAHLKVILETGELKTIAHIRKASEIALNAGGDFVKTSTGKISPAATPEAFVIMLDTILEFYKKSGKKRGIKPAGGISEPEQALLYLNLLRTTLGNDWATKDLFRVGASRLADRLDGKS
jgi:deoxyribose-phosphate aldolase